MPPETPRTTRDPASKSVPAAQLSPASSASSFVERLGLSLGLGRFGPADLVSGDLLETDAERLPGDGADLRRDHVTEAFAELVEVGVDVAGTPRGQRDEAELGVDAIEELLDRRVHHRVVGAFHVSPGRDPPASRSGTAEKCYRRFRAAPMMRNISSIVVSRSSLTTTWSASLRPIGLLVIRLAQPRDDTLGVVAARAQPSLLLLTRRREHEDQQGVRADRLDLAGAVDLDLEDDVGV